MSIIDNLLQVKNNIKKACDNVNRNLSEITLIAVSKTQTIENMNEVINGGIRSFGENYVQEIIGKYDKFNDNIEFHMIGHLQRNKVKYIIDKVKMIHSVDSIRLAYEINKEAEKKNIIVPILLEVNIAKENSKYGFMENDVFEAVKKISIMQNVSIKGLMTSSPYTSNPETNRSVFRNMKKLSVAINSKNIDNVNMNILSMGMSCDYQIAIEEGATCVRIGTSIFGMRNYDF